MNKFLKAAVCAGLCGTMVFAVACNKNPGGGGSGQRNDPEKRALSLSISKPDANFNPFFYTSQPDGQVINMTQASLITADYDETSRTAYAVAGQSYPTVAQDFRITYYATKEGGTPTTSDNAANGGRTEYEFLIKKGIKYSNGQDLTIRDVLFNFYVYLDTAYTGSNTMYSVDIQGLKAYQQNNSEIGDDQDGNSAGIITKARARMQKLIDYGKNTVENAIPQEDAEAWADIEQVRKFYKQELETDWNSIEGSWEEDFEVNYTFTEAWQAYLFQEGVITAQMMYNSLNIPTEIRVKYLNDAHTDYVVLDSVNDAEEYSNGKVLTTLDKLYHGTGAIDSSSFEYDPAIVSLKESIEALTSDDAIKEFCKNKVYQANLESDSGLDEVLTYWATAGTAYNYFVASEREKALTSTAPELERHYISGIRTEKATSFSSSIEGASGAEYQLDGTYDVLKIVINNVDPAAIWQFGISIAPITYYSGTFGGTNYIETATAYQNGGVATGPDQFGVKRGSSDFFDKVIQAQDSSKNGLPVGAGPYMASTETGGVAGSKGAFFKDNIVYYERNPYFGTIGTQIENAKIKYLRYKVVNESRIIESVANGALDYGEPTGSTTNQTTVNGYKSLTRVDYLTSGYGYVGINPTYVPDIEVRRIIMSAMNLEYASEFYGELAGPLYRSMSQTSWAYPDLSEDEQVKYKPMTQAQITSKLESLGYTKSGGIYQHPTYGSLKYTFTIAGGNTDHPAYNMFQQAAKTLNAAGFQITVTNDSTALAKLAKGQLAIWAAAWSSGVDPDMYQLYHKDSQATNVQNWGYRTILNDQSGKYEREYNLIMDISDLIDEGRTFLDKTLRAATYKQCLDKILDLAVELPIYQRKDMCIYNNTVIDASTLNQSPNSTVGLIDRIWLVNYI